MDYTATIISVISLLLSSAIAIFEIYNNKKTNEINLESFYLQELYKKYLTNSIPEARKMIHFNQERCLEEIEQFQHEIVELRHSLFSYKYSDNDFYQSIKGVCEQLEDYIVKNEGKTFDSVEEMEFYNKIESYLSEIYQLLNEKYKHGSNKSFFKKLLHKIRKIKKSRK